jgi:hypothetical protein
MPTTVHITDQGNQTISGVKTIEDLKTKNLYLNDLLPENSGVTFKLNDGDLQVSNKSGVRFGLNYLSALPFTGLNNIVLTSNNTTIKLPPNKNDFIAMSSEVVYNTGNQTISGVKTFANSGVFSLSGVSALNVPNNPLSVVGSGNSYLQLNIQNRASGTIATADLVITANNGTDTTNYINLGINNSGYNDPTFSNGSGLDGYLFINGGNLDIGTQTPNTQIEFHVGGTTAARTIARIDSSGLNVVSGNLTVGGTGVLLSGSTPFIINFSHTKNTPNVADARYYFGRGLDLGPATLGNNEKRRVQILQNCFLRRVAWASAVATTGSPTDAMTGYFKNFGNNPLGNDTTVGVQITQAINTPISNAIYNYSSGNLNIPINSGDYVSFYFQSNFSTAPINSSNNVDAYFYV